MSIDKVTHDLDNYLNYLSEDLHNQLTEYTGVTHKDGSSCPMCTTEEYIKRNTTSITNELYKISKVNPRFAFQYCMSIHRQFSCYLLLSEFLLQTLQDLYEDEE